MKLFLRKDRTRKNAESWQIIYIDLMTNVMVFFVILWAINQGRQIKISQKAGDVANRMVSLPGDIIFAPGKTFLTQDGKSVFKKLFGDEQGNSVLNFDSNPLTKRLLVIHGHTDGDGDKEENLDLAFSRAKTAYEEIKLYNKEIPSHVILCSHADNSPVQEIPPIKGTLNKEQADALRLAKAKNRRITIEDKLENRVQSQ